VINFKKIYFVIIILFFTPVTQGQTGGAKKRSAEIKREVAIAREPQKTHVNFENYFKEQIQKANKSLDDIKSVLQSFPEKIKKASYLDTKSIDITETGIGGIVLDFGYVGHGPLNIGFSGFDTKLDFVAIPNWLENAVKNALSDIGFEWATGFSPVDEFLIKLVLLLQDKSTQKILTGQFVAQLLFLMVRLSKTPEFRNISDLLVHVPTIVQKLINSFKIKGKSIINYLNDFWQNFDWMVHYNFEIEEKDVTELQDQDLLGGKDFMVMIKTFLAIALQAAVERAVGDLEEGEIKDEVKIRVKGLIQRIKGYKQLREKLMKKLQPIIDPLLESVGFSFNDIVSMDTEVVFLEGDGVFEGEIEDVFFDVEVGESFEEDVL
jgi:hypothetical protein